MKLITITSFPFPGLYFRSVDPEVQVAGYLLRITPTLPLRQWPPQWRGALDFYSLSISSKMYN